MRDSDDDGAHGGGCSAAGVLARVDAELQAVRADAVELDGWGASEVLAEVQALRVRVEAFELQLVALIESSQVWREDVNGTPASFLRRRHVKDHREAARDLRAAGLLVDFPGLAVAMDAGRVSRAHVDAIARVGLRTPLREEALPRFMPIFIETAAQAPVGDLRKVLRAWADLIDDIDPDPQGPDEEHSAHQRRHLFVSQVGDGVKLDGFFALEAGLKIQAVLNSLLAELFRHGDDHDAAGGRVKLFV